MSSSYEEALALFEEQGTPLAPGYQRAKAAQDAAALQLNLNERAQGNVATRRHLAEENYVLENSVEGVPLDVFSGLPGGPRAKMSFERNLDKRGEWLTKQPGVVGVRKTKDGSSLIARVAGPNGPRDVLVDERGFTGRDVAEMAGDSPQILATGAAAMATGGQSLWLQALATAGAGFAAGAGQDAIVRGASGANIDPGEIATQRGIQAGFDAGMPFLAGGGKRALQAVVAPFGRTAGLLEREAAESAARLNVPLTAGQRTGNQAVARAETFVGNLPGGGALKKQAVAQDEAIRKVQQFLIGADPAEVATESSIASRAKPIMAGMRAADEARTVARRGLATDAAQRDVQALLDAKIAPSKLTQSEAGNVLRTTAYKLRDGFRAQSRANYDAVYAAAGGADVTVPMAPVKSLIGGIKKDTSEAAKNLVPGIRTILGFGDELPKRLPLNQAIELRATINDQISRGLPIGDVSDRYLKRVAQALTVSIEQGVDSAPNKTLGLALQSANRYYRENLPKFTQRGVADLFKEATDGGFVDDSRIVARLFDGRGDVDMMRRTAQLLGPSSNEYRSIVRTGLQRMMDDATPLGDGYIDAGQFLRRLHQLDPEIRRSVLGPQVEKSLVSSTQILGLARGAKIDAQDVEKLLTAKPGATADLLRTAIRREKIYDQRYNRTIMKDLVDGSLGPANINPDEFVSRFVGNASARDVRTVLTTLRLKGGKDVVEDIRRRTLVDLLNKSGQGFSPDDTVNTELGRIAYDKLSKTLRKDPEKLSLILGKETMTALEDLAKVSAVRAKSSEIGGAAGQLVTSNVMAAMMNLQFKDVPRILKNRVMASLLTTPGLNKWLTQTSLVVPSTPRLRAALFASPPVIRSLIEEFKNEPDKLGQVLEAARAGPGFGEARQQANGYRDALSLFDLDEQ